MFNKRRVNLGLAILLLGGQVVKSTVAGRQLALLGEQSLKIAEALSAEVLRLKDGLEQQKVQSQEELQRQEDALRVRLDKTLAELQQQKGAVDAYEKQHQQECRVRLKLEEALAVLKQEKEVLQRELESTNGRLVYQKELNQKLSEANKQEISELKASNAAQLAEHKEAHQRALDEQKQSLERNAEARITELVARHEQALKNKDEQRKGLFENAQKHLKELDAANQKLALVENQNAALNEENAKLKNVSDNQALKNVELEEMFKRMTIEHDQGTDEDELLLVLQQARLEALQLACSLQELELSNAPQPTIPAALPSAVPAAAAVPVVSGELATATATTPVGRNNAASPSAVPSVANIAGGETNVDYPFLATTGRQVLTKAQRKAIEVENKRQNLTRTFTSGQNATHLNGNGSPVKDRKKP